MMKYKTRAQYVADDLRGRILGGEFAGGAQLRQDALAKDYDVSRIPVREALLILESEGLVEFHAHRGAFITELSVDKIRELFDLRVFIERYLLERSIPNLSDQNVKYARKILLEYDAALNSGKSIDSWSQYNFAFHNALYSPAALPEALSLVRQLNTKSDRYIRMQLLYSQQLEKAEQEHHELLEFCRLGEVKPATDLLESHILEACESIVSLLEKRSGIL
ncbi:GntR family transcriptional regulator [Halomonas huangheensis]|uniref:HTH gntR-type domain-containing protein n=1 Tax=Halomonas huangheensis TaxID=1178482 RepID=W1N9X8_9GAMM|nr:GntR family transcriptional regulator [Halomonas huangheensis]ALM53771.1 GntR family transcriptional regulator [Halomonas huangheensis]ERL52304.1 hypothetical protein BJB45_10070 [Halomonas huangheensis]